MSNKNKTVRVLQCACVAEGMRTLNKGWTTEGRSSDCYTFMITTVNMKYYLHVVYTKPAEGVLRALIGYLNSYLNLTTSCKQPPKPDIKGGRLREVPLLKGQV